MISQSRYHCDSKTTIAILSRQWDHYRDSMDALGVLVSGLLQLRVTTSLPSGPPLTCRCRGGPSDWLAPPSAAALPPGSAPPSPAQTPADGPASARRRAGWARRWGERAAAGGADDPSRRGSPPRRRGPRTDR